MRIPDPKANTTTEAYLAYKAGYLEESELKPVLYEPYLHFDAWLAYWAGLTDKYPLKILGKNLFNFSQFYDNRDDFTVNDGAISVTENSINYTGHTTTSSQFYPAHEANNKSIYGMMNLRPNTTYTISYKADTDTQCWIFFFNASNQRTQVQRVYSTTSVSMTFTTPEDLSWYSVRIDNLAAASNSITDIQVEQGSSASSYEPYNAEPEMLTDEEALVAYLSGATNTYPEEIKDPYDVRIVGYLKHLASKRWPEPDYPVNNEEFYLSTMEPNHTSNPVPSSDIELDTAEGKIISVEAYGDTYQQTYSGKNILPVLDGTISYGGLTVTSSNGIITINGTATGSLCIKLTNGFAYTNGSAIDSSWLDENITNNLNGKVLSIKLLSGTAPGSGTAFRIYGDTTSFITQSYPNLSRSLPFTDDNPATCFVIFSNSGYTFNNATYELQLETGSTGTSWEKYTGGIPAPNPDYPQNIQVVTGEQTVDMTGKNLYNLTSGPKTESGVTGIGTTEYFTMDGAVTGVGGRLVFNECTLPAGTYTATTYCDSGEIVGNVNFCVYKKNTWTQVTPFTAMKFFPSEIGTSKTATFTLSEDTSLWFSAYLNTNASFENLKGRFQIEKGSSSTTYQPYQSQTYTIDLGSIELCKIGDYQDYIYNSGDDWYVHKACGKVVFDGTEDWQRNDVNEVFTLSGIVPYLADGTAPYSDYFKGQANVLSYARMQNNSVGLLQSDTNNRTIIKYTAITTSSNFKTWLSTHNTTLYYPLATTTDTQITDATLVGQLEALAGADTYDEKTFIKVTANEPNLPALLKVEAYKY